VRLAQRKLPAVDATDLAVGPEGAERHVDPAQPREGAVEILRADVLVTDVDDDRHPHDLLDERVHARFAFRIADCSEETKASLVSVAPETRSILALWARKASLRRIGIAFSLM
jgi:hypothetical protein